MLNNFSKAFVTLSSPGSIAFYIGNWPVRWYGIFVACGFLSAYLYAEKLIKKNKLNLNYFNDLIFLVLLFGIVFARLYFVALNWDYYSINLCEIPKIWLGGQSIHGGIIGAVLACVFYSKVKNISFYSYMDVLAVVAPLGQSIGRWGNFFNNEAFGLPVENSLVRLYVPIANRPEKYLSFEYFHPTFLYESFFDFIVFIYLVRMFPQWSKQKGKTFWVYLLCYSIIRFVLEFLRIDGICLICNFTIAHFISMIIVLVGVFMLIKNKKL